jgi:hypothetical protein
MGTGLRRPVVQWFSTPVSAASKECAAGSVVVQTSVAAKNFQTGMRRLMNRSSGATSPPSNGYGTVQKTLK